MQAAPIVLPRNDIKKARRKPGFEKSESPRKHMRPKPPRSEDATSKEGRDPLPVPEHEALDILIGHDEEES